MTYRKPNFHLLIHNHIPILLNPMKFITFWMGKFVKTQYLNEPITIIIVAR